MPGNKHALALQTLVTLVALLLTWYYSQDKCYSLNWWCLIGSVEKKDGPRCSAGLLWTHLWTMWLICLDYLTISVAAVCRERWYQTMKCSRKLRTTLTNCWISTSMSTSRSVVITGSTVVLTCCKGDSSSQWETPIFGPPQTENPLTELDKICHQFPYIFFQTYLQF